MKALLTATVLALAVAVASPANALPAANPADVKPAAAVSAVDQVHYRNRGYAYYDYGPRFVYVPRVYGYYYAPRYRYYRRY
jgi:hypothetical protein